MKNFLKVAECDVLPLLHAVQTQPELWGRYPVRTRRKESAHYGSKDIVLRYNYINTAEELDEKVWLEKVCAEINCVNFPAFSNLPEARPIVFGLMNRLQGEQLGRVFISKICPGDKAYAHVDGFPAAQKLFPNKAMPWIYYDRYHVIMQSQFGVIFRTGDEIIQPRPGDVWWHNKLDVHEVINESTEDYMHMIIDIRTHHLDYPENVS